MEHPDKTCDDIVLSAELLSDAFLEDPRVISAEYKEGTFHIDTIAGPIVFAMTFDKEDA
jgi:hypothetical protein